MFVIYSGATGFPLRVFSKLSTNSAVIPKFNTDLEIMNKFKTLKKSIYTYQTMIVRLNFIKFPHKGHSSLFGLD